jgi:CheY-like chemotaxis protein
MTEPSDGPPAGPQERAYALLIVDDDALIRLTLSDHLQDQGFKVLEASTGDEALGVIAAPGFAVDLVFTDVMMPGVTDGFALAKWLRENHPEIPVIVTSGDAEKIGLAGELGEDVQFVPKPYDLDALTAQLRHTLEQKEGANSRNFPENPT